MKKDFTGHKSQENLKYLVYSVMPQLFFKCFLELFGQQFELWSVQEIQDFYDKAGKTFK